VRDFNQMPVNPAPNQRQSGGAILVPSRNNPTLRSVARSRGEIGGVDPAGSMRFFSEGRLRRLRSRRSADAGGAGGGRTEPHGEGSRSQNAARVPRVRKEGAGGGFGEVAGAGLVAAN
jgi:hypothetical protein